jgi:hypothetical protein
MPKALAWLFEKKKPLSSAPRPGSRRALFDAEAALTGARSHVAQIEGRIARLRSIVDAGAPAARELQNAVADDGAIGLAEFARGDGGTIAGLVASADAASRAADVARTALPDAERDLADAVASVRRLEADKHAAIEAILLDQGNRLAQRYAKAFRDLCTAHDELSGFARGVALAGFATDVAMASRPLEVPRFRLAALAVGEIYSTIIRHVPVDRVINGTSVLWTRFAKRLAENPIADMNEIIAAMDKDELWTAALPRPHLVISHRERDEPGNANEVLYDAPRPRRHLTLGSPAR